MFFKAVDTGGETKDAACIAGQLIDCIREVGIDNIIQVVIDSAAVCKAAGKLVEQEFSWITWTSCTPHCLDLLLEDVGKLPWAAEVVAEATAVVKFITNHHRSQALFRGKSALDLLKPGDTRFATNFIMLEVREALQELVVGREWREWNEKFNHSDDEDEVRDCVL
jgi:proline dehydrogenase